MVIKEVPARLLKEGCQRAGECRPALLEDDFMRKFRVHFVLWALLLVGAVARAGAAPALQAGASMLRQAPPPSAASRLLALAQAAQAPPGQ